MIYFSFSDIIKSIIAFLFLGVASGIFYYAFYDFISFFLNLLKMPVKSISKFTKIHKTSLKTKQNKIINNINAQFYDFVFVFICGIIYIVLGYIFLDGCFRVYTLIVLFISYIISYKTIGKAVSNFISVILYRLLFCLEFVFYYILYPIMFIVKMFFIAFSPIVLFIRKKHSDYIFSKLSIKKCKAISKSLKDL